MTFGPIYKLINWVLILSIVGVLPCPVVSLVAQQILNISETRHDVTYPWAYGRGDLGAGLLLSVPTSIIYAHHEKIFPTNIRIHIVQKFPIIFPIIIFD